MSPNEMAGSSGQRAGNAGVRPVTDTAGATGLHSLVGRSSIRAGSIPSGENVRPEDMLHPCHVPPQGRIEVGF
jgi:hypothetical protein